MEICDRLVKVDESSRNEPDARTNKLYADALNRTSELRMVLSAAKLI